MGHLEPREELSDPQEGRDPVLQLQMDVSSSDGTNGGDAGRLGWDRKRGGGVNGISAARAFPPPPMFASSCCARKTRVGAPRSERERSRCASQSRARSERIVKQRSAPGPGLHTEGRPPARTAENERRQRRSPSAEDATNCGGRLHLHLHCCWWRHHQRTSLSVTSSPSSIEITSICGPDRRTRGLLSQSK